VVIGFYRGPFVKMATSVLAARRGNALPAVKTVLPTGCQGRITSPKTFRPLPKTLPPASPASSSGA
jgi:hypothetical protein